MMPGRKRGSVRQDFVRENWQTASAAARSGGTRALGEYEI
jgi:hypothetical protein